MMVAIFDNRRSIDDRPSERSDGRLRPWIAPYGDPVGDDVVAACVRQSGSVEKIRHAIAFGGDDKARQKCSDRSSAK